MEQKTPEQESMCEAIATGLIVLLFKTIGFVFLFLINWLVLMLSSESKTSSLFDDSSDTADDDFLWEKDSRGNDKVTWFPD